MGFAIWNFLVSIIKFSLIQATKALKATSSSPSLDAEVLLSYVLKKSKEYLYANQKDKLSTFQEKKFKKLIAKRRLGFPIAYLIGHKEFFSLNFFVNKSVLVPRPETEELVELALGRIKTYDLQTIPLRGIPRRGTKFDLLDLGTGSGCIAITLAKLLHAPSPILERVGVRLGATEKRRFNLYASDISQAALSIARKNALKHKVKIKFIKSDLFHSIRGSFDVIIANLPYVTIPDLKKHKRALRHEPQIALKADWKIFENLFKNMPNHLRSGGSVLLEIEPKSKDKLVKFLKKYLPQSTYQFHQDLSGKPRFLEILV